MITVQDRSGASGFGVWRFKGNLIVSDLLDAASAGRKMDLNAIWPHVGGMYSLDDAQEFYQLIGYSVDGYAEVFCHRLRDAEE